MTRYVSIGHRLTGWNAVKSRVEQLKLSMTDDQIKDATNKIKQLADVKTQSMDDVDVILRVYHQAVKAGELELGDSHKLDKLIAAHKETEDDSPVAKKQKTAA
jgi:homocitrate synthase